MRLSVGYSFLEHNYGGVVDALQLGRLLLQLLAADLACHESLQQNGVILEVAVAVASGLTDDDSRLAATNLMSAPLEEGAAFEQNSVTSAEHLLLVGPRGVASKIEGDQLVIEIVRCAAGGVPSDGPLSRSNSQPSLSEEAEERGLPRTSLLQRKARGGHRIVDVLAEEIRHQFATPLQRTLIRLNEQLTLVLHQTGRPDTVLAWIATHMTVLLDRIVLVRV
jgi:hypothetical protein